MSRNYPNLAHVAIIIQTLSPVRHCWKWTCTKNAVQVWLPGHAGLLIYSIYLNLTNIITDHITRNTERREEIWATDAAAAAASLNLLLSVNAARIRWWSNKDF